MVELGDFISSAPNFLDRPKVLGGASGLMIATIFGDKGRHHPRRRVGDAALPADARRWRSKYVRGHRGEIP